MNVFGVFVTWNNIALCLHGVNQFTNLVLLDFILRRAIKTLVSDMNAVFCLMLMLKIARPKKPRLLSLC